MNQSENQPNDCFPTADMERGAAVAFGFFDGLHCGHQQLLETLMKTAQENGYVDVVHTFSNHPLSILGDGHPPMLFTSEEKWQALRAFGVKHVCMVPFTRALSQLTYKAFMKSLMHTIPIREVVVGFNYRLGVDREGTTDKLAELGKELGFSVTVVPPVLYEGKPISSTRIRGLLHQGDLKSATAMLGRPFSISGKVGKGFQLGSQIGFPTANTAYLPDKVLVPNGVYASLSVCDGMVYPSITNVGSRPTVSSLGQINIETHILEFSGDLYKKVLEVRFLEKIRDEQAFPSTEALSAQIKADIERAKKIHARIDVDYSKTAMLK